jgi:hypothetical protein
LLAAAVFAPQAGARASSTVAELAWAPLYERWVFGVELWVGLLVLLVGFAAGISARGFGAAAAVLLVAMVPMEARLPGRFVTAFAFATFALLRSDLALRPRWRRPVGEDAGVAGPIWPIRLIQIQLSILYGVNALAKATPAYLSGEVLAAMSAELPNFQVDLTSGTFPLFGLELPLALAAAVSVACELALAVGFWFRRARWATAAIGLAFHLGLTLVVRIGWLDVVAVALSAFFLLPIERGRDRSSRR